jgi:hypothetical protein
VEKRSPKIFATSAIFKNLSKENNRPTDENSPNPVTLHAGPKKLSFFFAKLALSRTSYFAQAFCFLEKTFDHTDTVCR